MHEASRAAERPGPSEALPRAVGVRGGCARSDAFRGSMQYRRGLRACIENSRHFDGAGVYCIDLADFQAIRPAPRDSS